MRVEVEADEVDEVLASAQIRLRSAKQPVVGFELSKAALLGGRDFLLAMVLGRDVDEWLRPNEFRLGPSIADRGGRCHGSPDQLALEPSGLAGSDLRKITDLDGPAQKRDLIEQAENGRSVAHGLLHFHGSHGEIGKAFREVRRALVEMVG